MSEFKLERFKYNWLGNWQPNYSYNKDDVVRVGAKSYVCFKQHVSNSDFNVDLEAIVPNSNPPLPDIHWKVMTGSQAFIGRWQNSYQYQQGDIVLFDGSLWLCNDGHFSGEFSNDISKWNVFITGSEYVKDWEPNKVFGAGAIVKYSGLNYRCITSHTSGTFLEDDENKWNLFTDGHQFIGDYTEGIFYKKNDYVNFGGSIYVVIVSHMSGPNFYRHNFEVAIPGYVYADEWTASTYYGAGDTVQFGGSWYVCLASNVNVAPTNTDDSVAYWNKLVSSNSITGNYIIGNQYKPGDLALFGGELYECQAILEGQNYEEVLDETKWKVFIPGQKWANFWRVNVQYFINDIIYYLGQSWKCNTPHLSNGDNFPGDNGKGFFYWDLIVQSGSEAGMNFFGDLLTYDFQREAVGDNSTIGPTGLRIGELDQLLSVSDDFRLFWRTLHQTETTVVYVSPTGIDARGRGLDPYHAFRTIQYACRFVEENNIMPCKISVSTGRYEEVLPIVIPKMTVVMGDELRSVSILPNNTGFDDSEVTIAYLNHLATIFPSLINGENISPQLGNTAVQVFPELEIEDPTVVINLMNNLFANIEENITSIVQGSPSNIDLTGTNNISSESFQRARSLIIDNYEFLTQECLITATTLSDEIDPDKIKLDIEMFLNGFIYDFNYVGNYKAIRYSTLLANQIIGSKHTNMFYVQDITGLRNCTTEGLVGQLTGAAPLINTTRVTGGAFVSLDPGWGPAHEETWINNRSPYVQGVTTIGTGCIGAHIDGILHNGGNRSMVANDFTQVLSDGIGAYILNRGRVELVSVFTYYCYVGYLAENGGTIRATNGNNSYGEYGSVALGIDDAETPRYATVNTRTTEASVYQAFAGEISDDSGELDRLLIFEYAHCGENYTNASATVVGSGNFVQSEYNTFRQGGIFEFRLQEPQDSTRIGGLGYTNRKNNAQLGTDLDIKLSATDLFTADDYIGQRLVITSGPGTGQYGYIQAYDDDDLSQTYRTATIYRESDDQPGWDHIVPGTTIAPLLTASTSYSIEPRIIVPHPGFSVTAELLSNSKLWTDIIWGTTTEIYNISLDFGTGEVVGIIPLRANFRVTKQGKEYSVDILNGGAGYAVDDIFVIKGDQLGGEVDINDLTIKVLEVTDDSTSTITNIQITGEGLEGKWMVVSDGNFSGYSIDGKTWTEIFLPLIQAWSKIINGNGIFICIPNGTSSTIAYSRTGTNWGQASLPSTRNIKDIAYGDGIFVILTNSSTAFYSTNGTLWASSEIPNSVTTDWTVLTYEYNKFIALSDARAIALGVWDEDTENIIWTVEADSTPLNQPDPEQPGLPHEFISITSNAGHIIALTTEGRLLVSISESINGWVEYSTPAGSYNKIQNSNGLYFITGTANSNILAVSENGIDWTEQTLPSFNVWSAISFGYKGNSGFHYGLISNNDSDILLIQTGKRAIARAKIDSSTIDAIVLWDPGSGYINGNDYELEIVDNSWVSQAFVTTRIGNYVLPQPTFINRGIGYRSSTTQVTISGNGYADRIPSNDVDIFVDGLTVYPGPGAQLRIDGIFDEENPDNLRIFTLVTIDPLGSDGSIAGTFRADFRISPKIQNKDLLTHNRSIEIRERYSQCRITGHDFLDIGTGNFVDTNYPALYAEGAFFIAKPEQEVIENGGGRVFYVSTDQDGNFRTGELFAVEQATGIVTISADFFSLDGLSELALGGVRLGGSGTVIREFSTDVNFYADSDNIIPTQRAVVTFIQSRISAGGGEVLTNELIAGQVRAGTNENIFSTTTGFKLNVNTRADFIGAQNKGVKGSPLALSYYFRDVLR